MQTHEKNEKRENIRELGLISILVLLWCMVSVWALVH